MSNEQALALAIVNLYEITKGKQPDPALTSDQATQLDQAWVIIRTLAGIG